MNTITPQKRGSTIASYAQNLSLPQTSSTIAAVDGLHFMINSKKLISSKRLMLLTGWFGPKFVAANVTAT